MEAGVKVDKYFYKMAVVSFGIAISIGLFLRWQHTGVIPHVDGLDIRRVHTHIGFYLFLFPIIWIFCRANQWTPGLKNLIIYFSMSILALLSFLFLGYGLLSKMLSGVVLLYWSFYAFKNLIKKPHKNEWVHPYFGILFAALTIVFIIYCGTQGLEDLAGRSVRAFMTFLVWGTFVPFSLASKSYFKPRLLIWLPSIILTSIYVIGLSSHFFMLAGPLGLSYCLFHSLYKSNSLERFSRIDIYWGFAAMGLFLFGARLIENHIYIAIGGLHFIVLGPVIQSIFNFKRSNLPWVYDGSLMAMVFSICAPLWFPQNYMALQMVSAVASTVLVLWLLFFLNKNLDLN